MKAVSWIYRKLTLNEFKAITDQIQSDGGGSQTYIDLPKGKITDDFLNKFFGLGTPLGKNKGFRWEVEIKSLGLNTAAQSVIISQRRFLSNCIREQNKEKRINIWKTEYSGFPKTVYNESENPIYIFIIKTDVNHFYAGWFFSNDYNDSWFLTKQLCIPLVLDVNAGCSEFHVPIEITTSDYNWPFRQIDPSYLEDNKSLVFENSFDNLQQIFFGAPGVGKSHHLKSIYKNDDDTVRITFHPETDYASFVGCYKPQTDDSGDIVYKFQGQAFAEAYIEAWVRYISDSEKRKDYFLIIEEINRGNCAQIFGDIFQLLDRNEQGFSDYSVHPDKDLSLYLKKTFSEKGIQEELNSIKSGLSNGDIMILPPNLHILATMNTSDQSLFPIDSAFKRRWDWVYMPIETTPVDDNGEIITRSIETNKYIYDWGQFLEQANQRIFKTTESEDKQLGFWFVKPKSGNNTISAKDFVSKVIFFLWNDVYKDFGDDATSIFNFALDGNPESKDKVRHSFKDFISGFEKVNDSLVDAFLKNLQVPAISKTPAINSAEKNTDFTTDENSN